MLQFRRSFVATESAVHTKLMLSDEVGVSTVVRDEIRNSKCILDDIMPLDIKF